jgi:hypothetical protein
MGTPLIWHCFKLIFFKVVQPETGLANVFEGVYPNCG